MSDFAYLTVEQVVAMHDIVLEYSGGLPGIRDAGLLESSLEQIKNDLYYPGLPEKLTHLLFSINKNHCFNDGNKRCSLSAAVFFLLINGYSQEAAKSFFSIFEDVVVAVAENFIDKSDLENLVVVFVSRENTKMLAATERAQYAQELFQKVCHTTIDLQIKVEKILSSIHSEYGIAGGKRGEREEELIRGFESIAFLLKIARKIQTE